MPPFGLYPIPKHHLYASSPSSARPRYSTLSFQDPGIELEPAEAVEAETEHLANNIAQVERKDKVKDDKKKKKRKSLLAAGSEGVNGTPTTPTLVVNKVADAETSTDTKKSSKKKEDKDTDDALVSTKKRKRDSEIHATSPSKNLLQNLTASVGDIGANFDQPQRTQNPTEKPLTKKSKTKCMSAGAEVHKQVTNDVVEPVIETAQDEAPKKKKSKKYKKRHSTQGTEMIASESPVVQNKVPATVATAITSPRVTPISLPPPKTPASTPRMTPIPLPPQKTLKATSISFPPQKSHIIITDTTGKQQRQKDAVPSTTEVFVTKTPPPKVSFEIPSAGKTPISPNLQLSTGSTGEREKAQKAPTNLMFPLAVPGNKLDVDEPSRGRAGSMASATSISIKDFAHMSKPSSDSSAEVNPFITEKTQHATPKQAETTPNFNAVMHTILATINFADEQAHLSKHLAIRASNDAAGPLPCLNKLTGCTAKKEAAIARMHSDPSHAPKPGDPQGLLFDAPIASALEAERFLHNAMLAQISVPTGKLEGLYSLYCPKYAESHIDYYGFGQRTLTISRASGFTHSNTYTARLSIPPRSVTYPTLPFTPPLHASFRTTTLTTSEEGYEMQLVVLGNGYVILRADLGLLLRGKKTDMGKGVGEDVGMEFWGVLQRDEMGVQAVRWREEGKNVVADKKKTVESENLVGSKRVEETSTKKKRGRPSKVELARRAEEKAAAARGQ
jgi:hypothetical protein